MAAALPVQKLLAQAPTITKTRDGSLRGEQLQGARVFRGVPFAQPPVGALRYRPPVKAAAWAGVRDATKFSATAMQPGEAKVPQSEDCLYLNVWAPDAKGPHPVFVWIHGGGFTGGRSFDPDSDGTQFAQQGVVVVTVAYRLGAFGFLDLEPALGASYAGSANNGLRDLIAAFKWVQENIADFGGDPAQVTIGGESAGAKLADILMGVPAAEKLFHQVISESGGAERVWQHADALKVGAGFEQAWRGAQRVGLDQGSAEAIIAVQKDFMDGWPQHFPLRAELDGKLIGQLPVGVIADGSTKGKRLLIGTNRDESALFVGPHPAHDATAKDLGNVSVAAFAAVYAQYKQVYPEMTEVQRRIRALTAEEYWVPTIRVADAHAKADGTAWMYQLDFSETSGRLSGYAYHSLDIRLVWDKPHNDIGDVREEAALAGQMHQAWLAFIQGKTPAAAGLPAWPQYEADGRKTMIFDATSRIEPRLQEAELRLWDGVL